MQKFVNALTKYKQSKEFEDSSVIAFLATCALDRSFLPPKFIFDFELERLNLNFTGSLNAPIIEPDPTEETPVGSKPSFDDSSLMLVGNFFILKILIIKILFNLKKSFGTFRDPDLETDEEDVEVNDKSELLCKQMGCYFYHIYFLDMMKDLEVFEGNGVLLEGLGRGIQTAKLFNLPFGEKFC